MTALPQVARVHHATVTRHSEGERFLSRPRLRVVKEGPVATVKVAPLLWTYALDAADGDARRIEVISAANVIIHNTRYW